MSRRKLGIGLIGIAVALPTAVAVFPAAAGAAGAAHAHATGTKVDAKLKAGTTMTLTGTIDGVFTVTVTCKSFTGSGTAPASGAINVTLPEPPKMSSCTDTLGGTDTVLTNQTNGKWKLAEVTSGTKKSLKLTMPKAAASFSSSAVSGCTITAAPTASASITGSFVQTGKDAGTDTVKNASIPVSGSGCTASSSAISATVVLAPVTS